MSDLASALIDAVAKALHAEHDPDGMEYTMPPAYWPSMAVAAIRAIDAHRAAQVRDGLNNLLDKAGEYYLERSGSRKEESLYQEARALKAALLALVGAQEEPSDV